MSEDSVLKKYLLLIFFAYFHKAQAEYTYTETFNDQKNPSQWSFGRPLLFGSENSNSYIYTDDLSDFSPLLMTSLKSSPFAGRILSKGTKSISVDLKILFSEFPVDDREVALELYSDNGTPQKDDDWGLFIVSPETLPKPSDGWKTFKFDIPKDNDTMPTEWSYIPYGIHSPEQPNWELIRKNVTHTGFRLGDPRLAYILMGWKIAADNFTIITD